MKGEKTYELVVIAGSAGAIEATGAILASLPEEMQATVIIVLHRMRNMKGNLENIFRSQCTFQVKEADDKEALKPGVIYVAPPNYHLLLEENRTLALDYSELVNFSRPSIDVTLESAAAVYKEKMIAVLLTGASNDGSEGVCLAQQQGALMIVQNPDDAEFKVMPRAALKKITADHVLPVSAIGPLLASLLKLD